MTLTVSCTMMTAGRRAFIPRTIALFLAQTEPDCELVILDQGAIPVADLVPHHPRIVYRHEPPRVLGAAQNRCCELSSAPVILHWDDDDWHGQMRVATQLAALDHARADLCGLAAIPFLSGDGTAAWNYRWEVDAP